MMNIINKIERNGLTLLKHIFVLSIVSALTFTPLPNIINVAYAAQTTVNFTYTGSETTWVVPVGVTSVTVDITGAESGDGGVSTDNSREGGRVQADLTVTPGETLYIGVGGVGGDNDGSTAGLGGFYGGGDGDDTITLQAGGGGGGQSYIKRGGTTDDDRVLVAGGGGGGSQNNNSENSNGTIRYGGWALDTEATTPRDATNSTLDGGGGGGGGWRGGAGALDGNNTKGEGGTNMAHSTQTSNAVSTQGYQNGNGYVDIVYPAYKTVVITSGTSWNVPDDWTDDNTIEVVGGGGSGDSGANAVSGIGGAGRGGGGGGGGAYSKSVDVTSITPGDTVTIQVGGIAQDTYICDDTADCGDINGTDVVAGAKGGVSASGSSGGAGGSSASGVASGTGFIKNSGGSGGSSGTVNISGYGSTGGGGGGGSAGSTGDGAVGGTSDNAPTNVGGTDGGAGGKADGTNGPEGGSGGTEGFPGASGTSGSNGTHFDDSHGSGSGGGGGGGAQGRSVADCNPASECNGGAGAGGGNYGAGGSGGGGGGTSPNTAASGGVSGSGKQGIIFITYLPAVQPGVPTSLSATANGQQIDLSWTAPTDLGGDGQAIVNYKVYRDTTSNPTTLHDTVGATTSYSDTTNVSTGVTYFYRLIAVNNAGFDSEYSTEDSAFTSATVPDAPASLTATAGSGVVNLSWNAPANDGGAAITNYKIYRDTASPATTLIDTIGNITSYSDTGVSNGTEYFYRVKATNSEGDSTFSNEDNATPQEGAASRSIRLSGGVRLMGGIRLR